MNGYYLSDAAAAGLVLIRLFGSSILASVIDETN
jgi:hypothetical protein